MSAAAVGRRLDPERPQYKQVLDGFSWQRAARGLATLARGETQADVLRVEPDATDERAPAFAGLPAG